MINSGSNFPCLEQIVPLSQRYSSRQLRCVLVIRRITDKRLDRKKYSVNIGIKHGFSCINIRQVPWEVLKTEAESRGFQHSQGTWRMLMH